MKNFLPISLDIAHHKILIIGGGSSAYKKLKLLQRFDAQVEVIALRVNDDIKKSGIKYYQRAYDKALLKDYLMLYSCSNDRALDKQIVADGKAAGVLVNIHDQPDLCQYVSPAIYKDEHITVAVGSNAQDVYASIRIRNEIKTFLEHKNHKE